ncbi:acyltransferase [Accumulibacter sp.]|nr:acyltransferase [Accumulibacter sp.]MCM8595489.1 acyltransferase [Accumulibacter sp.]MDS4049636.1 acyltransferase [Accumulibacter sp.]
MPFIDALKALASQLIVLHHLAFYGPLSDQAQELAPGLISWLSQNGRYAVQAFLVIGGFLAARSVAPAGLLLARSPLGLLWRRYLKLVTPFLVAVLVAIASAALARQLMSHYSIPEWPTTGQVIAHLFLLHGILGYDGLSAGVWYIAIDFQLFVLFVGVLWLARRVQRPERAGPLPAVLLVGALAVVSLYHFNRNGDWDNWGIYFFGSYALGIAACWATDPKRLVGWLLPAAGVVLVALVIDFRPRIAVALFVALSLVLARVGGLLEDWPRSRLVSWLGRISYSVFLIHFPVCLLISGLFVRFAPPSAWVGAAGVLIAWLGSVLAGALFHRFVETAADRRLLVRLPAIGAVRNGQTA